MQTPGLGSCPRCDSQLEAGYLGFASGPFWSVREIIGWRSLFPFVLRHGQFVVGSLLSTPWFRTRSAHRCRGCGALVVPADQRGRLAAPPLEGVEHDR